MNPKDIIEQCKENGLTLTVTADGNLDVVGSQDWIDIWSPILRENKAAILAELTGNAACNVSVTLPVTPDANSLQTHSDPVTVTGISRKPAPALESVEKLSTDRYSITCTDTSTDPVLVDVTIAGHASFTMEIPQKYYDGLALLELMEQHNAQGALNQPGNISPSPQAKELSHEVPGAKRKAA